MLEYAIKFVVAQFIARGDAKRRALIRAHGDKSPDYEQNVKFVFENYIRKVTGSENN